MLCIALLFILLSPSTKGTYKTLRMQRIRVWTFFLNKFKYTYYTFSRKKWSTWKKKNIHHPTSIKQAWCVNSKAFVDCFFFFFFFFRPVANERNGRKNSGHFLLNFRCENGRGKCKNVSSRYIQAWPHRATNTFFLFFLSTA